MKQKNFALFCVLQYNIVEIKVSLPKIEKIRAFIKNKTSKILWDQQRLKEIKKTKNSKHKAKIKLR